MVCDNKVGSAHSFCLVNKKIASLNIKIICYNLNYRKYNESALKKKKTSQSAYPRKDKDHSSDQHIWGELHRLPSVQLKDGEN